MIYTFGNWNVSEGHADEFEYAWEQSVRVLASDFPGVAFRLLRDTGYPGRYLSFGGPWRGQEEVDAATGNRAYQDSMAATAAHLVESSEVTPYELVLEVNELTPTPA